MKRQGKAEDLALYLERLEQETRAMRAAQAAFSRGDKAQLKTALVRERLVDELLDLIEEARDAAAGAKQRSLF